MTTSKNYIRDPHTHAVLNTNDVEYQNMKILRNRNKSLINMQNELNDLRREMTLLKQLLENNKNDS